MTLLQVSEFIARIKDGELTDRLAVVSRDRALIAAIDVALAAQPDVLEKTRDGKVRTAGAVIGAVKKAMKGQADAARVRELVLERAQNYGRPQRKRSRTHQHHLLVCCPTATKGVTSAIRAQGGTHGLRPRHPVHDLP